MNQIYLSPSKLNVLFGADACERCFYLENAMKVPRPRGIFPSLPGGIDRIAKAYHNEYRKSRRLPPYLVGKIPGVLFPDQNKLTRLQNWRTGATYTEDIGGTRYVLRGAIDDLIERTDNFYSTLDFKTKGSEPQDSGEQYYQLQIDCYELMLSSHGFNMSGKGFLVYLYPYRQEDSPHPLDPGTSIGFRAAIYTLDADKGRARAMVHRAAGILSQSEIPESGPGCEQCQYVEKVNAAL